MTGDLYNEIIAVASTRRSYLDFLRDARAAVDRHVDLAVDMIGKGDIPAGLWHPNGFATFEVATIEGLGLMRLHVWPRSLRVIRARQPRIHKHCFNLYSRVLAGVYRECQYAIRDELWPVPMQESGSYLKEYLVCPSVGEGIDRVLEGDRWLHVRPCLTDLRFPAGTWHELEVGKFHATPIPKRDFCVTLAVLSVPVENESDVLLGSPGFHLEVPTRRPVTEIQWATICDQFIEEQ